MRAVVQRVAGAQVTVGSEVVGAIGGGMVVLLGVGHGDTEHDVRLVADKLMHLRIFEDDEGKMNLSLLDIGGEMLVVSQFTLYADIRKGRRPSFTQAAPPKIGRELYLRFVEMVKEAGLAVATGQFGAKMMVNIKNDGPVTIILDSRELKG